MRHDDPVANSSGEIVDPVAVAKQTLRAEIRGRRLKRTPSEHERAAQGIAASILGLDKLGGLEGARITCFLSIDAEPGTGAAIKGLQERGARILVPRVSGADLEWVELTATATFTSGPFGILEPVGKAVGRGADPLASCRALLLPALAVDVRGYRLGQGGGFYDRALSKVAAHDDGGPIRIAMVFADEVLDRVPVEPFDCRVDVIATDLGLRSTSP